MAQATFDAAVKTRLPAEMKEKIRRIAQLRQLDESDIVREAIRFFLQQQPVPTKRKG